MKKIIKSCLILVLTLFSSHSYSREQSSSHPVKMLENCLNTVQTLSADFEQIDSNGKLSHGKFYLSRPGKLRLQYNSPNPLTIIADGQFLIHHDSSSNEVTTMAISETPAEFILRPHISFKEGVKITAFDEEDTYYKITLSRSKEPETGSLTLKFSKHPLKLIQWTVIDAQGLDTTVNLTHIKSNIHLNPSLFEFHREASQKKN